MTDQELIEFEQFKVEKERKESEARAAKERANYKSIVNELVNDSFPRLQMISELLNSSKNAIVLNFKTAIDMKSELFGVKDDQRSHTFSNEAGNRRITVGYYTLDTYDDTVNEGVAIVKEVIGSLAKDEDSKTLVDGILRLLSKDQKGNLKPSRIMQLRKMASELQNPRLLEGVKIIEESYRPTISKIYIKAELKNEDNAWVAVPLGITES